MGDVVISVFGLDEREQNGLRVAFRRHRPYHYVIDDTTAGDVALIDGDAIGAEEAVERELVRRPHRPLLVLTLVRDYRFDDEARTRVLIKPVSLDAVLKTLDELADIGSKPDAGRPGSETADEILQRPGLLTTRAAPGHSPARPHDPGADLRPPDEGAFDHQRPHRRPATTTLRRVGEQLMGLVEDANTDRITISPNRSNERYDPAQHLDGCLSSIVTSAHQLGQRTALVVDGDSVCYDPDEGDFISTGYFDWLDGLAASGLPCARYIITDASGLYLAEHSRQGSTSVLWRAALFSGRGRLRTGIPTNEGLRMRCWPDLPQLTYVSGMLPVLAALWARCPSIAQLVEDGHEAQVVNATIGALAAIDALDLSPELHEAWIAHPEEPTRTFLERLLKRDNR